MKENTETERYKFIHSNTGSRWQQVNYVGLEVLATDK